jgi:hypothetical protein
MALPSGLISMSTVVLSADWWVGQKVLNANMMGTDWVDV